MVARSSSRGIIWLILKLQECLLLATDFPLYRQRKSSITSELVTVVGEPASSLLFVPLLSWNYVRIYSRYGEFKIKCDICLRLHQVTHQSICVMLFKKIAVPRTEKTHKIEFDIAATSLCLIITFSFATSQRIIQSFTRLVVYSFINFRESKFAVPANSCSCQLATLSSTGILTTNVEKKSVTSILSSPPTCPI